MRPLGSLIPGQLLKRHSLSLHSFRLPSLHMLYSILSDRSPFQTDCLLSSSGALVCLFLFFEDAFELFIRLCVNVYRARRIFALFDTINGIPSPLLFTVISYFRRTKCESFCLSLYLSLSLCHLRLISALLTWTFEKA